MLMVEHHMEVVMGLAERIAVMHHGALLAFDTPRARHGRTRPSRGIPGGAAVSDRCCGRGTCHVRLGGSHVLQGVSFEVAAPAA